MSRWKDLPESLDPRLRQLVVQLREHKDRSELSITALASRTGFGKSSWDRYLNGRALPPEEAVEALARACDTEAAPLLALRELAAEAPMPSSAPETAGSPDTPDADHLRVRPASRQPVPWPAILLSSVTTSLVMLAGLVLLAPWEDTATQTPAAADRKPYTGAVHPSFGAFVYKAGTTYECEVERDDEDGLLYAGYSRTRTEQLQRDASRWAVVEAQCLLEHHGVSPGVVDGAFGNNTERAVRRLQDQGKIAVDGIVGPDTWKVLRT
ncbi:helix-turn-helix domain-containing protein [Streptomyces cyaneus]|uniref:helix-turn-helix domain-containing protein n=1 Tax=Streptomyces cyaneus TaxID=1904 RepID=UPI000FF880C7|nr:helix-turn-helix domain-containing protein [Streptomyces cyaneus]